MSIKRERKEQDFEDLADALVKCLVTKIQQGLASAAELSTARQLLQDAGIRINPTALSDIRDVFKNLPFKDDDQVDPPSKEAPIPFSPSIKEKSVNNG